MMRLTELQLTKDIKGGNLTPHDILAKYGWKVLGTGVSGSVAEHPNKNFVLKLFTDDENYVEFVKFVLQNSNNPHLPKISKDVRKLPGTKLSYVRMEKLEPVPLHEFTGIYFADFSFIVLFALQSGVDVTAHATEMVKHKLDHLRIDSSIFEQVDLNELYDKLGEYPGKEWSSMCEGLIHCAHNHGITYLDIHDQNFMSRNGTLVVTDPF